MKEVDKPLSADTIFEEITSKLKAILRQLDVKQVILSNLDREISSLCELTDVKGEIDEFEINESKTILGKIIKYNAS